MAEICFEDLNRVELRSLVRLHGRVPDATECARLRIQRLECEAVCLLGKVKKFEKQMVDPGLPFLDRVTAQVSKGGVETRYIEAMDEIEQLTGRYFGKDGQSNVVSEG